MPKLSHLFHLSYLIIMTEEICQYLKFFFFLTLIDNKLVWQVPLKSVSFIKCSCSQWRMITIDGQWTTLRIAVVIAIEGTCEASAKQCLCSHLLKLTLAHLTNCVTIEGTNKEQMQMMVKKELFSLSVCHSCILNDMKQTFLCFHFIYALFFPLESNHAVLMLSRKWHFSLAWPQKSISTRTSRVVQLCCVVLS